MILSELLENKSIEVRKLIIEMLYLAGSGHPGSSLSSVEIITNIVSSKINWNSADRERFVLSKGHAAPALYSALVVSGLMDQSEIKNLRKIGSSLQGHPDRRKNTLIDAGTGALGQGLSISIGYAIGDLMNKKNKLTFCLLGDGELQEGQIWEAALFASARKLSNLCCFIDVNRMQNERETENTLSMGNLNHKFDSFGWNVIEIDGHNHLEINKAINLAKNSIDKPTMILANTVKGKGISFMENAAHWHGKKIETQDYYNAMKEL
jgi:transketolase